MKKIYFFVILVLAISSCQQAPKESTTPVANAEMNTVVENIMNRRSIRSYKPEQISDTQLDTIIRCAINAPSAMNRQTWEIRIVQNPELLKDINDGFIKSTGKEQKPDFSIFHGAPTLVIVAQQKDNIYSTVDCSMLGQNILLAAESMDIGTCVIAGLNNFFKSQEAQETIFPKFNLPEGYEVIYTISMGYKNEHPDAKPRDKNKVQVIK